MKHNFKRTLSLVLALVMALSCMSLSAFADSNVAQIGETGYATLAEAIAAAKSGDKITVSAGEFEIAATTVIPEGVTIQGAGKDSTILTITTENDDGIKIKNPNVTIKDLTIDGTNIKSGDNHSLINVKADGVLIDNVVMTGGGMSDWNSSILVESIGCGGKFTVSNSTISGSFRGVLRESCGADIVINNCDIDATYPINIDGGYKPSTVTVNGGVLHGWTSYSAVDSVTFNNVTFSKANSGYDCVAAYVDTTFNNCTFDAEFKTYAQESGFTWTFTNCTEDGTLVTKNNFKLRFPEDSDVWNKCTLIVNGVSVDTGSPDASIGTGANAVCCDTLAAAVKAAGENDTITLLGNVTLTETCVIPKGMTVTLDLSGHEITCTNWAIQSQGDLTIKDSVGDGVITSTANCGVNAMGMSGKLTIQSGTITAQEMAVMAFDGATVEINGGTFNAKDNAVIGTNGTNGRGNNNITINGGTFNGGITSSGYVACGIYAANDDTWNINGGTFNITGGAGIVARAGTVNVGEGVTINTTGNAIGKVGDSNVVVPCAALVFDSRAGYPGKTAASQIAVSGGMFTSKADAVQFVNADADTNQRIALTGGTYSSNPAAYVATGSAVYPQGNKFTVAAANAAVAKIGDVKYLTLEDAVAAAVDSDTITVLADCSGNGIQVPQGKFTTGLTVDFGDHTYKMDGTLVGSTGTETQAFQLLKDNKITFQNGTLTSAKAKMLVQNYSNLTLDGMTLTLNNPNYAYAYTLSNNNGNIVIDDTTINANPAGGFAFDVCRYASYPSVSVTVKGSSVINGNIEASASGSDAKGGMNLVFEGGKLNGRIIVDASAKAALKSSTNSKLLISGGKFASDPRTEGVTIDNLKTVTSNTDDDKETYPYTIGNAETIETSGVANVTAAKVGETTTKAKDNAPAVATTAYEVITATGTEAVKLNVVPEVDDKLAATAPTTAKEVVTVAELAGINAENIEAVAAAKVVESTNAALADAANANATVTGDATVTNTWDIVTKPETVSNAATYVNKLFESDAESYKEIPYESTASARTEMTQAVTNAAKVFNTNVTNTTVIQIGEQKYTGTAVVRADDNRYYEHKLEGLTKGKMYEATGFHGNSTGLVKTERAIKAGENGEASLITKGLSIVTVKESNKTYVAHVTVGTTTYYFESFTGNNDHDKNAFDCVTDPNSEVYGQTVVLDVAGNINFTLAAGETLTVNTNGKQGVNTFVVTATDGYYIDKTTSGNVVTFVSRELGTLSTTGGDVTMIYENPTNKAFTTIDSGVNAGKYANEISFIKSGLTVADDGTYQYVLLPVSVSLAEATATGSFKGIDIALSSTEKYEVAGFVPAAGVVAEDELAVIALLPEDSNTDFAFGQDLGALIVKVKSGATFTAATDTITLNGFFAYDEQLQTAAESYTLNYTVPIGYKVTVNAIMDDDLVTPEAILSSLTIGDNGWYKYQTNNPVSDTTIANADRNVIFASVAENYYANGTNAIPVTWEFAEGMANKYQYTSIDSIKGEVNESATVTAPASEKPNTATFTAKTSDATVNVHFEAKEFTISFMGNKPTTGDGGNGYPITAATEVSFNNGNGMKTQTVKYNVKANLNKKSALDTAYSDLANDDTLNTLSLTGWTFDGWTQNLAKNFNAKTDTGLIADGGDFTLYTSEESVAEGLQNVYAKWSPEAYKIYAAYNDDSNGNDWAALHAFDDQEGGAYLGYAKLPFVAQNATAENDRTVTSASAIAAYSTDNYIYTVQLKTAPDGAVIDASDAVTVDGNGKVTISSTKLYGTIAPGSKIYVYVLTQINATVKAYPLSNNVVLVTATNAAGKQLKYYNDAMEVDARYGTTPATQVMLIDYSMGGYTDKTLAQVADEIKVSDKFSANAYVENYQRDSARTAITTTADIAAGNYNVNGSSDGKVDIVDITLVYNAYKGTYSYAANPAKGGRLSASVSQYLLSDVTFTKSYDDSTTDSKAGTLDELTGTKTQLIDMLDVKAEYTKAYSGT